MALPGKHHQAQFWRLLLHISLSLSYRVSFPNEATVVSLRTNLNSKHISKLQPFSPAKKRGHQCKIVSAHDSSSDHYFLIEADKFLQNVSPNAQIDTSQLDGFSFTTIHGNFSSSSKVVSCWAAGFVIFMMYTLIDQ